MLVASPNWTTPSMSAIKINNLTKRYGDITAVSNLSLSVGSGEIFGFLGPNGAGKSTTINMMLDFTTPTSGSVHVFGHDAHQRSTDIRRRTGLLLEGYGVYPRLTGREHVEHAIETKNADDDPDELLARIGMTDVADRRAGSYSKGMCQRMAIAVALVGSPELLVLDEPSTGLDPNGARRLRDLVIAEAERGATVFFSSHILEQVEAVADRIAILLDGKLAATGSVADLRTNLERGTTVELDVMGVTDGLLDGLRTLGCVHDVAVHNDTVTVACDNTGEAKLRVLNVAANSGTFNDFTVRKTGLDDVFSRYTEDRQ